MAERIENSIEINDLPPEETLTPEEKERIAGAGRQCFRPTFDALEARELMTGGLAGAIAVPPVGDVHQATIPEAPATTVEMPAALFAEPESRTLTGEQSAVFQPISPNATIEVRGNVKVTVTDVTGDMELNQRPVILQTDPKTGICEMNLDRLEPGHLYSLSIEPLPGSENDDYIVSWQPTEITPSPGEFQAATKPELDEASLLEQQANEELIKRMLEQAQAREEAFIKNYLEKEAESRATIVGNMR